MRELIQDAPERIESEYEKTENNWLSCLGSCVFQVETNLGTIHRRGLITDLVYEEARNKLEHLKERLIKLQHENDDSWVPQAELKKALLDQLNIF